MNQQSEQHRSRLGFTNCDALIAILVIGAVTGGIVEAVSSIRRGSQEAKLRNDVRALNSAVAIYRSNGGNTDSLTDAKAVINALKRTLSEEDRRRFAGAGTGALVDPRLNFEALPETERNSKRLRAYWEPSSLSFKLTGEALPGIKRFTLDATATREDTRGDAARGPLSYASSSTWVWDYVEVPVDTPPGQSEVPLASNPPNSMPQSYTPIPLPPEPGPATQSPAPDDEESLGNPSGGIALNLGDGSSTSSDGVAINLGGESSSASEGIALNLLSDNVEAQAGEVSLGVLGIHLTLFKNSHPAPLGQAADPADNHSSDEHRKTLSGRGGLLLDDQRFLLNLGDGEASATQGIGANLGQGSADADQGAALNLGEGSSLSQEGISGNIGGGTAEAHQGIGLNLGSGSAEAGSNP